MKYENAKDILPAKLLEEVQKYVEGRVIYIPRTERSKGWGEASGYRDRLDKRNALICSRYSAGMSVMEIAEEFFLSPETVKKLVYGKKVSLPVFSPTIVSARAYASAGMGEEWVRMCLSSFRQTMPDISDCFMSELVKIPLRLIDTDSSGGTCEKIPSSYDVPLIVFYENRVFSAPYQPELLSALRAEKRNAHYAFIFARNDDYSYFWNNYGKHFAQS